MDEKSGVRRRLAIGVAGVVLVVAAVFAAHEVLVVAARGDGALARFAAETCARCHSGL